MSTKIDEAYNKVVERIKGPIFRDPLRDFMDENCNYFIDIDENTPEMCSYFKEFINLLDSLRKKCCEDFKITEEQFNTIAEKGLKDPKSHSYFKQLLNFEKFDCFKRMMIERNYQIIQIIESEMCKKGKFQNEVSEEDEELLKAIEESKKAFMEEEEKKRRLEELNKREFQRALKKSKNVQEQKNNIQKKKNDSNNENNKTISTNPISQSGNSSSSNIPKKEKPPKINDMTGFPEIKKKKLPSLNQINTNSVNNNLNKKPE